MDYEAIARKIHPSYDSLPVRARGYYREYVKKVLKAAGMPEMEKRLQKAEKLGMAAAVLLGRLCVLKDGCDHCPSDVRELCRATHEQEG